MNTTTFKHRITKTNPEKIYTKEGLIRIAYDKVIPLMIVLQEGKRLHMKTWSKSFNHWQINGEQREDRVIELLQKSSIEYRTGNDAKKGGRTGDFIELTKKGLRQCKDINFDEISTR